MTPPDPEALRHGEQLADAVRRRAMGFPRVTTQRPRMAAAPRSADPDRARKAKRKAQTEARRRNR